MIHIDWKCYDCNLERATDHGDYAEHVAVSIERMIYHYQEVGFEECDLCEQNMILERIRIVQPVTG